MDTTGSRPRPTEQPEPNLRTARGTCWAIVLGAIGFAAPIVLVVAYTVCRWFLEGSSASDRKFDLHWLPVKLIFPAVGTASVFAFTGWATFAPGGSHRFTSTLAIVFAFSLPSWFILAVAGMSPPRYKGLDHPLIYPSEVLMFLIPPLITGVVLSVRRYRAQLAAEVRNRVV